MKKNFGRKIPWIILAVVGGTAAFTALVMLLWNGVLPAILPVSAITFWQAAGILLLSKILFGGFRGRRAWHSGCGRGRNWRNNLSGEGKDQMRGYGYCRVQFTQQPAAGA